MKREKIFFIFFTFLFLFYFINSNLEISNLTIKKENSSLFFDEKVIVSKIEFSQESFTLYDSTFPFYFKNENNSMTNFSSSLSFSNLDYGYNISSLLGCLDENATNYNFFSLFNSDICEYEEEIIDIKF